MRFPVILHTGDGVRYGVTVPYLPGCFSFGEQKTPFLRLIETVEKKA